MGFFNHGLMMACFWLGGSTPSTNNALQMLAIMSDSTGHSRLMTQVGAGSDECLSGEPMMIFDTSDGVVGWKISPGLFLTISGVPDHWKNLNTEKKQFSLFDNTE